MPRAIAKSLAAFTASYSLESSPSFLHGHIQLAESETLLNLSVSGAHMILVRASAIDRMEPLEGSISPAAGACPIDVAIPFLPL